MTKDTKAWLTGVCILAILVFNKPLLSSCRQLSDIYYLPPLLVYFFGFWVIIIGLTYFFIEKYGR